MGKRDGWNWLSAGCGPIGPPASPFGPTHRRGVYWQGEGRPGEFKVAFRLAIRGRGPAEPCPTGLTLGFDPALQARIDAVRAGIKGKDLDARFPLPLDGWPGSRLPGPEGRTVMAARKAEREREAADDAVTRRRAARLLLMKLLADRDRN